MKPSFKSIMEKIIEEKELDFKKESSLGDSDFAFPKERKYPIETESSAERSLIRAAMKSEDDFEQVKKVVGEKYPSLKEKECWDGYKKQGTKKKDGKTVNNCVKEGFLSDAGIPEETIVLVDRYFEEKLPDEVESYLFSETPNPDEAARVSTEVVDIYQKHWKKMKRAILKELGKIG